MASATSWRELATAMLKELARAPRATWAFTEQMRPRDPEDIPDLPPDVIAALTGADRPADAKPQVDGDKAEVDAMLDRLEDELDGADAPSTPRNNPQQARCTIYRPRPAVLLALIRLAKTFGSVEVFAEAMASPAGLRVLCTGSTQLDKILVKILSRVVTEDDHCGKTCADTFVTSVADAVRGSGETAGQIFGALTEGIRSAVEKGSPVVVVAPLASALPAAIKALAPQIIRLAPLDREMLLLLLSHAYPAVPVDDEVMANLPDDAAVSRLDADSLTLALRARDPITAIQTIAAQVAPVAKDGPGLAEFPLPAEVRGPVEQLVADLRAWQSGEIPWRDVSRGLLLVGPPGSGKTEIPRLIAREAGIAVVAGSVAQWSSDGSRSSEMIKAMRGSFAKAAAQAPALLFIDELDSFGDRARAPDHNSSYTDYIVTALLDLLDGFHGHEGVVVMGATNHIGKIDAAIRRPGRFDTVVTLGYPNHELMPQAIKWQLAGDLPGADLSEVAIAAAGMSGAEIAAMVRAARAAARKDRRALSVEDLSAAIAAIRPPLPPDFHWLVAVHEAGHAIVGTATGLSLPDSLAILPSGGFCAQTDTAFIGNREEIEALLAVDLAGRAAERLVLGQVSRGAGGSSTSDLARATRRAAALEVSWGLGETQVWLATPEAAMAQIQLDPLLRNRVADHLERAEERARQILQANRAVLEEMATALKARKFLSGAELESLTAKVKAVQPDAAQDTAPPSKG